MTDSTLVQAWLTADEVTRNFLDAIPAEAFEDKYTPRTRTVSDQFKHVHYVRVHNLKERGKAFLGKNELFEKDAKPTKRQLVKAYKLSGTSLAKLLAEVAEKGKVKSWAGPPESYLGYLIAHEAHHRALAIVALRFGGHKLSTDVTYGLWGSWRRKR